MTTLLFLAGAEVRSRWRALVVLGLATGLVAGSVLGLLAVARRTTTAYERLDAASAVDDARGMVIGGDEVLEELRALPEVEDVWFSPIAVGQLVGAPEVAYLGVAGGFGTDAQAPDLTQLVPVEGRLPAPGSTEEVVLAERIFRDEGIALGDEFTLRWLTPEEFDQFDTGFGDADGAEQLVRVVGAVRVAGSSGPLTGLFGSDVVAQGDPHVVGHVAFVRLQPGASFAELQEGVTRIQEQQSAGQRAEDFLSIEMFDDSALATAAGGSARVLGGGLAVAATAVLLAGVVVLGQAWARHNGSSGVAGATVGALGVTRRQQRRVRAMSGVVAAVLAGGVAAACVVAAGRFEPIGDLRSYEPHPGTAVHLGLAGLGAVAVAVTTVVVAALVITRPRRPVVNRASASWWQSLPPPMAVGVAMAVDPAWRRRSAGRGAAFLGVLLAVLGLAGAVVFGASLDRLLESPRRQGLLGDFRIADIDEEVMTRLEDDPRVDRIAEVPGSPIELDGIGAVGHAYIERLGTIEWDLIGRPPATDDEIALGRALANRLDVNVGDAVTARTADGSEVPLRVVGVGVIPPAGDETFGRAAALSPEGFEEVALTEGYREAVVGLADGVDVDAVLAEYAAEVEASPEEPTGVVADLVELRDLPLLLSIALVVLAALALTHPLVVAVRRRGSEVATLRALGFTGRQLATTVLAAALAAAGVALLVGVPVGILIGRLIWRAVASNAGVLDDADLAAPLLLALAVGIVLLALLAALWPARRAARLPAGVALRSA